MSKGQKVLLFFASFFCIITAVLLVFEILWTSLSLSIIAQPSYKTDDAFGIVFSYLFVIIFAIFTVISGIVVLPFNIILFKKVGRKWFNLTILIVDLAFIVTAIILVIIVPVISNVVVASNSSSSSTSETLLIY